MTKIIDGKACAQQLKQLLARELAQLSTPVKPHLAILQVADNLASTVYVKAKIQQAKAIGMATQLLHFPESVTYEEISQAIDTLNKNPEVHGIIVQLPLPSHLQALNILNQIIPEKDVDGLSVTNAGKLSMGLECLVPCTPLGCLILLEQLFPTLDGRHVVIIGRSNLVGKPLAQLLLQKNCTVSILHSKSVNPEQIAKQADILISAAGVQGLVKEDWVKPGATVIDVGIHRLDDGTLAGDVDFASVQNVAGNITPVPGGVGPMTVACLLFNTLIAMARQNHLGLKYLPLNPLKDPLCL